MTSILRLLFNLHARAKDNAMWIVFRFKSSRYFLGFVHELTFLFSDLVYAKINIIFKTAIINHNLSCSQNVTSWFEL